MLGRRYSISVNVLSKQVLKYTNFTLEHNVHDPLSCLLALY